MTVHAAPRSKNGDGDGFGVFHDCVYDYARLSSIYLELLIPRITTEFEVEQREDWIRLRVSM